MKHLLFCCLMLFCVTTLHAQPPAFLAIGTDARAEALGGTQLGTAPAAMSLFANPAQTAGLPGLQAQTTMTQWIADISQYGGAVTLGLRHGGTLGLTGIWMDYGSFTRTATTAASRDGYTMDGTFSVAEYALGLAYAQPIAARLSLGAHLQYAAQQLPQTDAAAGNATTHQVVMTMGTVYQPGWKQLRLGAHLQQGGLAQAAPPETNPHHQWMLSGALDLMAFLPGTGLARMSDLTLAYDRVRTFDQPLRQHLGLEYALHEVLFLRSGYRVGYEQQGLTAGLGVRMPVGDTALQVDYAYSDFGTYFGSVHRFGFGVGLR